MSFDNTVTRQSSSDDDDAEAPVLKLKKKSSPLAENPESLLRKRQFFQSDPFRARMSANLAVAQRGECSFHHTLKYRPVSGEPDKESQAARGLVPLPPLTGIKNLELCPSFKDFTFCGWRPENDPRPAPPAEPVPPPSFSNLNDDYVFDMNRTPEPIPVLDCGGGGMHDRDLAERLSTVPLDYSYFKPGMEPAHLKVKLLRKDEDKDIAVHKQAKE